MNIWLEIVAGQGGIVCAMECLPFFGAVCSLEAVWDFSDICNGLMAVPNLLAVVMLSQGICREIRTYKL